MVGARNGSFYSTASSSNLKAVNGRSSANSNIKLVKSKAGSSYDSGSKVANSYYTTNRELGITVTNYGTPTIGTRNSHSSVQ